MKTKTSLQRHKSAPYLRLKNDKSTLKCQIFLSTVLKKNKRGPNCLTRGIWRAKREDSFGFLNIHCFKISKIEGRTLWEFFWKKSRIMPKKLKGGTL